MLPPRDNRLAPAMAPGSPWADVCCLEVISLAGLSTCLQRSSGLTFEDFGSRCAVLMSGARTPGSSRALGRSEQDGGREPLLFCGPQSLGSWTASSHLASLP